MKVTEGLDEFMQEMQRNQTIEHFRDMDDHTREYRVNRYLEVENQWVMPAHHFSSASRECLNLYRDGHFIATVMVTQAVNEGIIRFVAERNNMKHDNMKHSELLKILKDKSIISQDCFEASDQIRGSFRNDVHHMNPKVATIDFQGLAKKNIHNLTIVEREVFNVDIHDGKIIPKHPEYWFEIQRHPK